MIILDKPYVSDFLIQTIKENKFSVLNNEVAREFFSEDELISVEDAKELAKNELFYSNSENSLDLVFNILRNTKLIDMISTSKNKVKFRDAIKEIFPNYYFKEVLYSDIKNINPKDLKIPLILKPTVGFLSFGVFPINNSDEWNNIIKNIDLEIEKIKGIFPNKVVDTDKFILEELIEGEEYAIDGYFDFNGHATILNIYKHPFIDGHDVSDRVYYTSKSIIKNTLHVFRELLDKVGQVAKYKNFPFHLELRYDGKKAIPIEINPMRFCGWCITDITYYAWNINVYEAYFYQQKPDWDYILSQKDDSLYYFTIADIPTNINKKNIYKIQYDKYMQNISNPIDLRKIDYKYNPIFAIVFAKTNNFKEIKNLLSLNMNNFIDTK